MKTINDLQVKIFCDGAKLDDFKKMKEIEFIKGYTTNPTLMKRAGVSDYESFIKEVMPIVENTPVSFEVIADEFDEMKRQALKLSGYGDNVYVKIPIMNTKCESSLALIDELTHEGVNLNITAIMTLEQVGDLAKVINGGATVFVSVFAGRIANTGRDPVPIMKEAKKLCKDLENAQLLWASSRELLNIFQAEEADCDIITVTPGIIDKIKFIGYDLYRFSHDTVKMFYDDAASSGFNL